MNYKVDDKLLSDFTQYASQHGVPYDAYGFNRSKEEIKKQLKTFVARIAWDDEGLYRCANQNDPTYNKAIEMLK